MGDATLLTLEFATRTVVLTVLLCVMVKIQKLNFFFPGLLASAVIACGLDTIPVFGHFIAVPVLYFCVWKVTGANPVPDAVLTVVISYALMFGVKLLVFTVLLGDLRAHDHGQTAAAIPRPVAAVKPEKPAVAPPPATNQTVTNTPASAAKINSKTADEILKAVIVKGATRNGAKTMLILSANKKNYTLVLGEQTVMQTTNGTCRIRLVSVSETWAAVEVNGESAYLRIP